jgi:hypothetical protein
MADVCELRAKPEPKRPPLAAQVFAWSMVAAVGVPTMLAVVYGSVWLSVWLVRAIGGLV